VRHILQIALLAVVALLAGCIGGRSPSPDYYMLTARAQGNAPASDLSIGVGPIKIAQFLTRPPIVTHAGGSGLQIAEDQRWGEPLDQGVQRVTLQNLAALTGAQVRNFPWRQTSIPGYAVRLDVLDLDRLPDGGALLEVTWALEDLRQNKLLSTQHERLTTPVNGDYDALVVAYSDLLAQLAQRIAAALPR